MKRIINFRGRMGRYDVPSFLFTENEPLEIKFDLQVNTLGKYIAILTCGKRKQAFVLDEDKTVIIPPEFIKRGDFAPLSILLELRTMLGDKIIIPSDPAQGGFCIEPLYIEKVGINTTATAWCQELAYRCDVLENKMLYLEEKIKEFEDKGVPIIFEEE